MPYRNCGRAYSTEWKSTGTERPPSRVVVVSTILTQALLRGDRAKHGKSRASLIAQAINVRERTVPPVGKYSCGTWVSISYLDFNPNQSHEMEQNYLGMVLKMREATVQGVKDCARILSDREFGKWVLVDSYFHAAQKASGPDYKVIWVTDWSKFGEYELDFGFGKPVWVSLADVPLRDLLILMNTKDNDGIEAVVFTCMSRTWRIWNAMRIFECLQRSHDTQRFGPESHQPLNLFSSISISSYLINDYSMRDCMFPRFVVITLFIE
ncbi:Pelargonidin 3-O-(6-caffeoylglucoside) 5-O-(6-O-malonylglucoside) 4'''-malonyltransferase [Sesamum angolense]|uniref:Pelargonidin 3-O-(6-caffeoylglucoside) 5-O-(6-O-malonylglucoside) 4'''-malonyltransferase n=1 Tax=Sesamum angolense TaxID=2727404 RepID=A0AAE1X253_9LAMI|nr:Pelargonidin 3-O-(6-caffeoylglucoside) 5-O-(6-O-malonylglucoside) 4'''-malonyltransferase [Sesamum angolense]